MSNKETLQNYNTRLGNNNTDLKTILDIINNLPEAGSGDTEFVTQTIEYMQAGTLIGTPPNYLNTKNKNRGTYLGFDIKITPGQVYTIIGQEAYEYRVLQVDEATATAMKNGETVPDEMFIADTGYMSTHIFQVPAVPNAAYLWCMCRNPNNYETTVELNKAVPISVQGNVIEEPAEYIQDGLIAWFDGEDELDNRGYWLSRVGNDYIYPKSQFTGTALTNPIPHGEQCYYNNKAYNLVSTGNYLKKGYTIQVVGKVPVAGWLITMNMSGTPGIGVNDETIGRVVFRNSTGNMTDDWPGYLRKVFNATLHLDDIPDRADSQTSTRDITSAKIVWSGSVNGSAYKEIVNATENLHYKESCTPILHYYASTTTEANRSVGQIYSLRVYNRKLTEEELQHNYEIDKARFNIEE